MLSFEFYRNFYRISGPDPEKGSSVTLTAHLAHPFYCGIDLILFILRKHVRTQKFPIFQKKVQIMHQKYPTISRKTDEKGKWRNFAGDFVIYLSSPGLDKLNQFFKNYFRV